MAWHWAGTDIGKAHHHTVVLNAEGEVLFSRKVVNDEPELQDLISDVLKLGEDVIWAVDVADGMASLLVNVLLNHGQTIVYLPGLAVNRASAGYRGLGKTDAKDARVIADQARMRRDLHVLTPKSELAAELRVMTDRRADLVKERTRKTNRLHAQVLSIFPALEHALELTNTGPLMLLSGYQTPAGLRHLGRKRLASSLRRRKVRSAEALADAAVDAADRQHTRLPGEEAIAQVVRDLALELIELHQKIHELDKLIEIRFHQHELAPVIASLPGIGPLLGAEFLAATGGDLDRFPSADRLAAFAGVAPVHAPRGGNRQLKRAMFPSAFAALHDPPPAPTTTDAGPEGRPTPRHFSAWPASGSTCCSRCSATAPSTNPEPHASLDERDRGTPVTTVRRYGG